MSSSNIYQPPVDKCKGCRSCALVDYFDNLSDLSDLRSGVECKCGLCSLNRIFNSGSPIVSPHLKLEETSDDDDEFSDNSSIESISNGAPISTPSSKKFSSADVTSDPKWADKRSHSERLLHEVGKNGRPLFRCTFATDDGRKCNYKQDKGKVEQHFRIVHLRYRPHTCPIPGCGQKFTQGVHVKAHVNRVHTGDTPCQCRHCNETFVGHAERHKHETRNHPITPRAKRPKGSYTRSTLVAEREDESRSLRSSIGSKN